VENAPTAPNYTGWILPMSILQCDAPYSVKRREANKQQVTEA
jgi:hypothetical protein